jgi:DNA-binding NarL/FixJ family response regulator
MQIRSAQKLAWENKVAKGFNTTDVPPEFCLLQGEIAEAFDAWHKGREDAGEELADVAIYLLSLAEMTGIDLQDQLEAKMAKTRPAFTAAYQTAFSRRETPTLTSQVVKWVEELTTAVLEHHASGFIYRSTDDIAAVEALPAGPPRSSQVSATRSPTNVEHRPVNTSSAR